jgi:hypothetical protein
MPEKDLFLSYNSHDRTVVDQIRLLLELRRVATFIDSRDLTPGLPWFDELEGALREVRGVAVFFGPFGLGLVQKRELQIALNRQVEEERDHRSFPVVPVMLPGSRPEDLSAFCALNTWLDLRGEATEAEKQLDRLVQWLRRDSVSHRPLSSPAPPSICPYRALEVFREEDFLLFFGRDEVSQRLLDKVLTSPLTAVVGASGSGKSSLVQAGLVPLLRRQKPPKDIWEVLLVQPRKEPFYEIAVQLAPLWLEADKTRADWVAEARKISPLLVSKQAKLEDYLKQALDALHSSGTTRLLLVIDQFEQLFTHDLKPKDRRDFVDALLEALTGPRSQVSILITLRADFLNHALELGKDFVYRLNEGTLMVGPMDEANLRKAIEGPARRTDLEFESGLVDSILNELGREPGELALLEFSMTELWHRRQSSENGGEELTSGAFNQIGRVHGAIAARADSLLPQKETRQLERLERALLRMVHVAPAGGEAGADARRVARLADFPEDERALLVPLIDARLLVTSSQGTETPVVQVAHEALIRRWQWLRERIEIKRTFLLWRQELQIFLEAWQKSGRTALLPLRLQSEAGQMLKSHKTDLNSQEREFIESSMKKRLRLRRRWQAVAAFALLCLVLAGGYVYWRRSTSYTVRETIRQAATLVASDVVDLDWFEVLALTDREEAWRQAQLTAYRGDPSVAFKGILKAIRRPSPSGSPIGTFGQFQLELDRYFPKAGKSLAIAVLASTAPGEDSCNLLKQDIGESRQSIERLLAPGSRASWFVAESILECSLNEELKNLISNTSNSRARLTSCIKIRDEVCIKEELTHIESQNAAAFLDPEWQSYFGMLPIEAIDSKTFEHFASSSRLGKAIFQVNRESATQQPGSPFKLFTIYRDSKYQMTLDENYASNSLLARSLLKELNESLRHCYIGKEHAKSLVDLSIQLGPPATETLADCIAACRTGDCPVLFAISASRILLTWVSRELRSRGNLEKASELAWLAITSLAPLERGVYLPEFEGSLIPRIEEILPVWNELVPANSATTIAKIELETSDSPAKSLVSIELLRWNLTAGLRPEERLAIPEVARQGAADKNSLLVLVDAAFYWASTEQPFAIELAIIAEDLVEKIPLRDRARVYCELSAFYAHIHHFSKALLFSQKSLSRGQQFYVYTQLLREYLIEKDPAKAQWWPNRPKLPRYDF